MVAKEIRRDFEYKDALLASGQKISGKIITVNNKFHSTDGDIKVEYPDKSGFTFKLYQEGARGIMPGGDELEFTTLAKNSTGVKTGMDDNAVIEEFKQFIKQDIGLTE